MPTITSVPAPLEVKPAQRLPVVTLAALAVIGFVLVAMETMPAGLLPVIAAGLGTSEGTVGLFVSAYALGTVIVTIPAITLTRGMRRKPLLLTGIVGQAFLGSSENGVFFVSPGSLGRPRTRSPMMLRWIWSVPP